MARKKRLQCLGFGEFENVCQDVAGKVNPFWCERCNRLRMEHLGRQFENLEKALFHSALGKS